MPHKGSIPRICEICGRSFSVAPHVVKKGGGRFCSTTCRAAPPAPILAGDGSALIPLRARDGSTRAHAIVDATDAEWISRWAWRLSSDGYAFRQEGPRGSHRAIFLHRELMALPRRFDGREVDHRNRNKLDCRRENMRVLSKGLNPQNVDSRRNSSSSYRGVSWDRANGKWRASIRVNRKEINLGRFTSETEAAEAARAARQRLLPYSID
jgi:hypothetical protein